MTGGPNPGRVVDRPRYGSVNETIAMAMALSRSVVKECEGALAALHYHERQEVALREADVCRCVRDGCPSGHTLEDAVNIEDDDDDEVEVLAITLPPRLPARWAASGDNSCGSVFNPSERGADDDASS